MGGREACFPLLFPFHCWRTVPPLVLYSQINDRYDRI